MTYYLRGASSIDIVASADGTYFSVSVVKADTLNYKIGHYWWEAYVTDGTSRYKIDTGELDILPDFQTQFDKDNALDGRSYVKTVLDAIEAVILQRASKDQMGYSVAGKTLSNTPIPDLLVLRDRFKKEYQAELDAKKIEKGLKTGRKILTRFIKP